MHAWWQNQESGWGITGLALALVPVAIAYGMSALGGPWPGDTGLQILASASCAMFVAFPLCLVSSVIGLCHKGRLHFASFASIAVAAATFIGISGRSEGRASEIVIPLTILSGAVYLVAILLRIATGPQRLGLRLNENSQGIKNVQSDRDN